MTYDIDNRRVNFSMTSIFLGILISIAMPAHSASLSQYASITEETTRAKHRTSDYIELELIQPSFSRANTIKLALEGQLGPNMVMIQNDAKILVQAPRDPTNRAQFIAYLLSLPISP